MASNPEFIFPGSMEIDYGGHRLRLLPDRAVWWPARQALLLADVHLGKGAAFRKAGLPVPSGSSGKDLKRISALLKMTGARRLLVLGDLIHARGSHQPELWEAVARWREGHRGVEIVLVRGNHDRSAGRLPGEWGIEEVEGAMNEAGIVLAHEPMEASEQPMMAGHVHPVVWMRDFDGSSVSAPCFVFDRACAILPAFGSFTGGHGIEIREGRRVFVTSGKRVCAI